MKPELFRQALHEIVEGTYVRGKYPNVCDEEVAEMSDFTDDFEEVVEEVVEEAEFAEFDEAEDETENSFVEHSLLPGNSDIQQSINSGVTTFGGRAPVNTGGIDFEALLNDAEFAKSLTGLSINSAVIDKQLTPANTLQAMACDWMCLLGIDSLNSKHWNDMFPEFKIYSMNDLIRLMLQVCYFIFVDSATLEQILPRLNVQTLERIKHMPRLMNLDDMLVLLDESVDVKDLYARTKTLGDLPLLLKGEVAEEPSTTVPVEQVVNAPVDSEVPSGVVIVEQATEVQVTAAQVTETQEPTELQEPAALVSDEPVNGSEHDNTQSLQSFNDILLKDDVYAEKPPFIVKLFEEGKLSEEIYNKTKDVYLTAILSDAERCVGELSEKVFNTFLSEDNLAGVYALLKARYMQSLEDRDYNLLLAFSVVYDANMLKVIAQLSTVYSYNYALASFILSKMRDQFHFALDIDLPFEIGNSVDIVCINDDGQRTIAQYSTETVAVKFNDLLCRTTEDGLVLNIPDNKVEVHPKGFGLLIGDVPEKVRTNRLDVGTTNLDIWMRQDTNTKRCTPPFGYTTSVLLEKIAEYKINVSAAGQEFLQSLLKNIDKPTEFERALGLLVTDCFPILPVLASSNCKTILNVLRRVTLSEPVQYTMFRLIYFYFSARLKSVSFRALTNNLGDLNTGNSLIDIVGTNLTVNGKPPILPYQMFCKNIDIVVNELINSHQVVELDIAAGHIVIRAK